MRIVAYILNGLLIAVSLLLLLRGGVCGALIGVIAGGFNIAALRQTASEGFWGVMGLICNLIALLHGVYLAYAGFTALGGQVGDVTLNDRRRRASRRRSSSSSRRCTAERAS